MTLALYGHPFSSYTQEVLIALYENATPFEFRCIGPETPEHVAEWLRRWPIGRARKLGRCAAAGAGSLSPVVSNGGSADGRSGVVAPCASGAAATSGWEEDVACDANAVGASKRL